MWATGDGRRELETRALRVQGRGGGEKAPPPRPMTYAGLTDPASAEGSSGGPLGCARVRLRMSGRARLPHDLVAGGRA